VVVAYVRVKYACIYIYYRINNYYYYYTALAAAEAAKPFCSAKLNSAFPYGTGVRLCVFLGARTFAHSADSENF
jgi:hypothetical protein